MIFITVGTEQFPFDRLLKIIDDAKKTGQIEEEIFAQIGSTTYLPRHYKYIRYLSFGEIIHYIKTASIIISHAGVGSLLLCLELGKKPILFPRLKKMKEHVDDHQLEFIQAMVKNNRVILAHDEDELLVVLKKYTTIIASSVSGNDRKRNTLVSYLKTLVEGDLKRI